MFKNITLITTLLFASLAQAQKEGDNATQDFLWQFVREQVDEEATASGIVDRIKRMGDSSLFNLDEQYGRRQD